MNAKKREEMWVNRIFGERKRDDIAFVMQLNQLLTFQVDFTLACLVATRVKSGIPFAQ